MPVKQKKMFPVSINQTLVIIKKNVKTVIGKENMLGIKPMRVNDPQQTQN